MKKVSECHLPKTLDVIGGKWKLVILWYLSEQTLRFSQIEKNIPEITQKMLSQSLKELEKDRLVKRKVYSEIPPRVEYSITSEGVALGKALKELEAWGEKREKAQVR